MRRKMCATMLVATLAWTASATHPVWSGPPAGAADETRRQEADPEKREPDPMPFAFMVIIDHCCGAALAPTAEEISFIEGELQFSPAQQPAWRRFAATLLANDALNRAYAASATPEVLASPTSNRLDLHISTLEAHLAAPRESRSALATLYPQLSLRQKERFDRLFGSQPIEAPEAISVSESREHHT